MKKYRMILGILLFFDLFLLGFAGYWKMKEQVPDSLHMESGKEMIFPMEIPAMASIYEKGTDKEAIGTADLNQTVLIKAAEQGKYEVKLRLFGVIPLKTIDLNVVSKEQVIPCGNVVGIYVHTKGVLVVDIVEFQNAIGEKVSPSKNKLKRGDYIYGINGKDLEGKDDLIKAVNEAEGNPVTLQIYRNGEKTNVQIKPDQMQLKTGQKSYYLGIWVRDDMQGIGTMTYRKDSGYAALGHSINDIDTGKIIKVGSGDLYEANVVSVIKGKKGTPGELTGFIMYGEDTKIGSVKDNGLTGIHGTVSSQGTKYMESLTKEEWLPIGYKQDVKKGKAVIRSNFSGEFKDYEVRINKIRLDEKQKTKGMEIEVTDPELLNVTGGIVQGMSGSPIIQNGKVIGAVTHVFVNDPTKGYGIFIENMMEK